MEKSFTKIGQARGGPEERFFLIDAGGNYVSPYGTEKMDGNMRPIWHGLSLSAHFEAK